MNDAGRDERCQRGVELLATFRRGAELTQALIEENQRIRRRLAELEDRQQAAPGDSEKQELGQELLQRIHELEEDRDAATLRLQELEAEHRQVVERYLEVEGENHNLANLYVSSLQLHASLDLPETLGTVLEIVINLVGADRFAVYIADEKTRRLQPVAAEGAEPSAFPTLGLGEGPIGACVVDGEVAYPGAPSEAAAGEPIVCIPLRVQERPVGAIAIFSLLQQKRGFTRLDHELFGLLAGHAATAILAAQLHGESERKLSTVQGFLELLTK